MRYPHGGGSNAMGRVSSGRPASGRRHEWPSADERREMLEEAVTVIAELFTGELVTRPSPETPVTQLTDGTGTM